MENIIKKKIVNKRAIKDKRKNSQGLQAPKKLKLLVTIIDRTKLDYYLDTLEEFDVNLQMVLYGKGTASSQMLHYLGLGETEKAVILSFIQSDKSKVIMNCLDEKFKKVKNGNGVAYTLPLNSLIGVMIYQYLCNTLDEERGE